MRRAFVGSALALTLGACSGAEPTRAPAPPKNGVQVDQGEVTTNPPADEHRVGCRVEAPSGDPSYTVNELVDAHGRIVERRTATARELFTYDAMGRTASVDGLTFQYDGAVLHVTRSDRPYSVFDLDAHDRVVAARESVEPDDTKAAVTWSWNDAGQITSATFGKTQLAFSYDGERLQHLDLDGTCRDEFVWSDTADAIVLAVRTRALADGSVGPFVTCRYTFDGENLASAVCDDGTRLRESWWSYGSDGWVTAGGPTGPSERHAAACDYPPRRSAFARRLVWRHAGEEWVDPRHRPTPEERTLWPVPLPVPPYDCFKWY